MLDTGVADYIHKSVQSAELIERVKKVINRINAS